MNAIAAATNRIRLPGPTDSPAPVGITVNATAPVAGMEPWRLKAIQKVTAFDDDLAANWDAQGSNPPSRAVRQTAIALLLKVPGGPFPAPRIVPVSGGGLHFEWAMGERELEISIDAECNVEGLGIEGGIPLEDEPQNDLATMFAWLANK